MANRFYSKEIPETAVIVNGISMRFDILETADAVLIAELDKCIARGVGGVVAISEAQYQEEVKKKASGLLSPDSLNKPRQRQELSANQLLSHRAAAAGGINGQFAQPQMGRPHTPNNSFGLPRAQGPSPDPIEVPTAESFAASFSKPPTAKMSEVKATV